MNNVKFIIVALVLLAAAGVALSSYLPSRFESGDKVQVSLFPMNVGDWVGKDIALTQRDYDILETKNLIMREYKHPSKGSILFYIIYSENNRKVLHPPEVCYLGSGATIAEKEEVRLTPGIKANKMVTELTNARQLVVYWYKAGNFNTVKYFDQQLKVSIGRLFGKTTSSAMIRISADMKEGEDKAIMAVVQDFAAEIEPLLAKYVP